MKKILILLLSVAMLVTAFSACGKKNSGNVNDTASQTSSNTKKPTNDNNAVNPTGVKTPKSSSGTTNPSNTTDPTDTGNKTNPVEETTPAATTSPSNNMKPTSKGNTTTPPAPSSPNKGLAQKNGPVVKAIYWEDGEIEEEYFAFSEAFPYFTDKDFTWILDLEGKTVTLSTVLVLDTNISIVNGTIKTTADAYVENNKSFSAGEMETYRGRPMKLESNGLGIQNNAELYLRCFEMTVNTGIGVLNAGTVCRPDTGNDLHSSVFKSLVKVEAYVGTTCFHNKAEMNFGAMTVQSNGGTVLHNEASGIVYTYPDGSFIVTNGTAILNYGLVQPQKSDSYEYYSHECTVNGGYAIENHSDLYHVMDIHLIKGTAIRNYPEGSFIGIQYNNSDTNSYSRFNITMDSGTAVYNEGSARLENMVVKLTAGCVIDNYGIFTPGSLSASVKDGAVYTGTMINNHKGASLEGSYYYLIADATQNAIFVQNDGFIKKSESEGGAFAIYCGYTQVTDEYAATGVFNPFAKCENTYLVKNCKTGLISDAGFQIVMAGTGVGQYVGFYNEPGTVLSEELDIRIDMFSNDAIGIHNGAESIMGSIVSDGETYRNNTVIIGEQEIMNSYLSDRKSLYDANQMILCPSGNTGILNDGTFKHRSIYSSTNGKDNRGILNNHAMECDYLQFYLLGSNNVGLQNEGSVHTASASADVNTSGDGIGINNNGNLYATHFSVRMENATSAGNLLGLNNKGLIEVKGMTEGDGLVQEARLSIESHVDDSVGLYNSGQIHCYALGGVVSGEEAVGILNDESGYIEVTTDFNSYTHRKNNIGLSNSGSIQIMGNAAFFAYNQFHFATMIMDDTYSENTCAAKIETSGRFTAENIELYSHGSNTGLSNYGYVCAKNKLSLIDYYEYHVDACYLDMGGILSYGAKETTSKDGLKRFEGN